MKKIKNILILLILLFTSCSTMKSWLKPITHYDQHSYENFVTLKVMTKQFIDSCSPQMTQDEITAFLFNIDIIYEYEIGKGDENTETIKQFDLFIERLNALINEAQKKELSQDYKDVKKETLTRILDVMIKTEYQKPR